MAIDYVTRVRSYNSNQLVTLLQDIRAGRTPAGWAKGKAFEHLVLRGFELDGAEVEWPYEVGFSGHTIEQIDGAVHFQNTTFLIESKDYKDPLNIEPIAKMRNQLMRRPSSTMGIVFGRSNFSVPMKDLTRMMNPLHILLWEVEELEEALQAQATPLTNNSPTQGMCKALHLKFRAATIYGMPDFDIKGRL